MVKQRVTLLCGKRASDWLCFVTAHFLHSLRTDKLIDAEILLYTYTGNSSRKNIWLCQHVEVSVRLLKGIIDEWLKILLLHHSTIKKTQGYISFLPLSSEYSSSYYSSPLNWTTNKNKNIWQYEKHTLCITLCQSMNSELIKCQLIKLVTYQYLLRKASKWRWRNGRLTILWKTSETKQFLFLFLKL